MDYSGEDVGDHYIFTWNKNPNTITDSITFITLQVHIRGYLEKWVIPTLEVWIYSHKDHMKLDPKEFPGIEDNRNDYLSKLLDNKFNGRTILGTVDDKAKLSLIGELRLTTNTESLVSEDFMCRRMIFETKDINDSLCKDRR